MTRHLLRLIWNRKRRNALLCVEIFCSFVVVAVIATMALNYGENWRQGIGFRVDDVWVVQITPTGRDDRGNLPDSTAPRYRDIMTTVRQLPGVQAAAAVNITPYSNNQWRGDITLTDGRRPMISYNLASDDLPAVLGLNVVAGRWFTPEDARADVRTLVINQQLATEIFGDRNPIGELLPEVAPPAERQDPDPRRRWKPSRVVGVIREFRQDGELGTPTHYAFSRTDPAHGAFGNNLLVRTAPGVPAEFEERLQRSVQQVAPDWSIRVRRFEDDRQSSIRVYLALLLVPGVIAAFLILMVALGLIGVLWQHVTERTREFGLRRATGASAAAIRRQVLTELAILASFALVPGALLGLQTPALPIPAEFVPGRIMVAGVAVAVVTLYAVVLACGWYPSRMATAVRPAEALHYE